MRSDKLANTYIKNTIEYYKDSLLPLSSPVHKNEYSVKEPSLNLLTDGLQEANTVEGFKSEDKASASARKESLPHRELDLKLGLTVEESLRELPSQISAANPESPVVELREEAAERHLHPVSQKIQQQVMKPEVLVKVKPSKLKAEALRELVAIWEKNIPPAGRPLTLTEARAKQLDKIFKTHLNACVKEWQKFVELISTSDFLMGKSSKFRVSFDWALKEPNALKIMEGSYKNQEQKAEVERKAPDPLKLLEQNTSMDPTWKLFLQKLIKRFDNVAYELWLSTMQMVSCEDGTLKISVPTEMHQMRIENDYGAYINVTAKNLFGVVRIRFEAKEGLCKA